MLKYALRRLAYAIPLVLGVTTLAFFMIRLVPGDPGRAVLGPHASPRAVRALDHTLGLDQPLLVQYWQFLRSAVTLDFGASLQSHVPAATLIGERIAPTCLVIVYALVVAVVVAVPLAVVAAVRQDRLADHAIRLGGMAVFVMPPFWFGLLLALVFGVQLRLLPTSGYDSGVGGVLRTLTLPAFTLGLGIAPLILRTLRAALIETLSRDFVEAARARGFGERRVLYRHALRNSLVSALTLVGLIVAALIGGSVIIESVFNIPGIGQLMVTAVAARDFPVLQALIIVMGTLVVVVNLLTDLGYAVLDPRVRL